MIVDIFHLAVTGGIRELTKYPAAYHHHLFQNLTTGQLIFGLFLYGTVIVLGTVFFAVTLQKLDSIYFFELYNKLFLKIQNNIDFQLAIFYSNPSRKSILKFFIDDVSPVSVDDYQYIWRLFNIKLNLPLPVIESAPRLYVNYSFVSIYILFLIILLLLIYWFFCGRTFVPTVLKSTYILSHKRSATKSRRPLYRNFYRDMHSIINNGVG